MLLDEILEIPIKPFEIDDLEDFFEPSAATYAIHYMQLAAYEKYYLKLLDEYLVEKQVPKLIYINKKTLRDQKYKQQYMEKKLEVNEFLLSTVLFKSSFQRINVDFSMLEDICEVEWFQLMGGEENLLENVIEQFSDTLNQREQILVKQMPELARMSLEMQFGRRLIFLCSEQLARYLNYAVANKDIIRQKFQKGHERLMKVLQEVKNPYSEKQVSGYCKQKQNVYIIGFYEGANEDSSVDVGSLDLNFISCFYILEELLDCASSFFSY